MSEFFYESKSKRVVRNINKTLEHRLEVYNFDSEYKMNKIKNELLKIHGLCNSRFDFINSIEKAIKQNINDVSIDDNSNKQEKTVESIIQEATSPFKKLLGYDYLYREMRNLYGKDEAKRLSGLMYDFTYALSDSTNILKNYCWALNASVLLTEGRPFGQLHSSPSKHLDSYLSALTETIHQLSSHLAGAIAIGTLFIDSASLLIKDGYNIYDLQDNDKRKIIENAFQRFIYSVNHISRSSSESPFTNVSIFDKIKLKHLINESIHLFPDSKNIEIYVEFIYELQQIFMNIFEKGNPIQNGLPFRFPVVTINISKDKDNNIVDLDFLDNICNRDIERYNIFTSEGTKVASCCFDENQKILCNYSNLPPILSTFKDIFSISRKIGDNPKIYHNGNWQSFKRVMVDYNKEYYKITTSNNKSIIITDDHLNPTLRGDISTNELNTDDYLLFNNIALQGHSTKDEKLTYNMGYLIGMYLGDGSIAKNTISLSLNENKYNKSKDIIQDVINNIDNDKKLILHTMYNNVYPCVIHSEKIINFIRKWVNGEYAHNKNLNLECLNQSIDFRKGILDGWYNTDGGNSNRCYSTSSLLIEHMEVLCNTLGLSTIIDISDRTDEKVIIRNEEFNRNYKLYCLRYYTPKNKRSMKDVYIIKNNSIYFKINKIEKVTGSEIAYCVETNENEPYFTLPNGIITHNCRLISNAEMLDIASQSNSFGGGGSVSLGSHRVLTLNMNRIALLSNKDNYIQNVINSVDDIVKILKAHRELIKRTQKQGVQMFMDLGWISLNRMFSTVGILGYNEISHTLNTDDNFLKQVIIAINDEVVKKSKEYNMPINIEQIPAESMAVRLCNADKLIFSDDKVPFNLYSNQFIPLWQESTIWDRLKIDGMFNQLITGGGIVHAQIRDKVTPSQAKNIIAKAIEYGCEHFALNPVFSKCSNNHIHIGRRKICPECCEPIVDYMTRVVGFFTNISAWNPTRKNWEFKNRQFVELE